MKLRFGNDSAAAALEAEQLTERVRAARAREELLTGQLAEVEAEAAALEEEHTVVSDMLERRRVAQEEDERVMAEVTAQVP